MHFTQIPTMLHINDVQYNYQLLMLALEKEVADVNRNGMCNDRKVWDILCDMAVLH
jgi:hypothetical protein